MEMICMNFVEDMESDRGKLLPFNLLPIFLFLLFSVPYGALGFDGESFLACFSVHSPPSTPIQNLVYSANDSSFSTIFYSNVQNLRFNSSNRPKPLYIITPKLHVHVQAAVKCSMRFNLQIRVRSGGHDYEGLSYISDVSFVLIDLANLNKIETDWREGTAKVEAGATLGELYYKIANSSETHAFPAGICPTVGAGGHISGGGQGVLLRKFGLAADNVVDAILVKPDGEVVNRTTMGEDLFWAIRGGGVGASFGIVVEWTLRLVPVPARVTHLSIVRDIEHGTTDLVHLWQQKAHKFDKDLFMRLIFEVGKNSGGEKTLNVIFNALFLGTIKEFDLIMSSSFPELNVKPEDCKEMSWIESVIHFNGDGNPTGEKKNGIEVLLDKTNGWKGFFKAKSDYVVNPIAKENLSSIWQTMMVNGDVGLSMFWDPYGGRMSEISESETPFPHRKGVLFNIQYYSFWESGELEMQEKHLEGINRVYDFMTPFVTSNPRTAYANYRDLDIGVNGGGEAREWGEKYYKGNFERLAKVKAEVDRQNYFKNEQSIPPSTIF